MALFPYGTPKTEKKETSDLREYRKIMMPMIRNIYPSLIANDIIGVQPMTSAAGNLFVMSDIGSYTRMVITKMDNHWNCHCSALKSIEILEWLKNIDPSLYWSYQRRPYSDFYVNFYDEESITMFKLRWDNLK